MRLENRLNSLIRAGRHVIDTDFDVEAFLEWKREAAECMNALTGPEHVDTMNFHGPADQYDRKKTQV